jgi:integrase
MDRGEEAMIDRLGRGLGPGRLERRGDQWVLDWKNGTGRRRRQALSRDRRVAERMRAEIIHQRDLEAAGLGTIEGQSRPLAELMHLYIADLSTRAVEKHVVNARAQLEEIMSALRVERVRDLKPILVMQHRAQRVAEGASHRTANLQVNTLKAMLNWAVTTELIAQNPIGRVKGLPEGRGHKRCQRRAMTDEEIARFLVAAEKDDRKNEGIARGWSRTKGSRLRALGAPRPRVPQAPLWRAFLETGARYGELVRATWADVDLQERTLTLRAENTKSGRPRVIPLREILADQMATLREVHERVLGREPRQGDRIFRTPEGVAWCIPTNNIMRIFDRLLDAAKIERIDDQGKKLDIHALRHTFASRLARSGVGLSQVQRLLGHRDPKLTAQVYTHLDVDDLRKAVERIQMNDVEKLPRRLVAQ